MTKTEIRAVIKAQFHNLNLIRVKTLKAKQSADAVGQAAGEAERDPD